MVVLSRGKVLFVIAAQEVRILFVDSERSDIDVLEGVFSQSSWILERCGITRFWYSKMPSSDQKTFRRLFSTFGAIIFSSEIF